MGLQFANSFPSPSVQIIIYLVDYSMHLFNRTFKMYQNLNLKDLLHQIHLLRKLEKIALHQSKIAVYLFGNLPFKLFHLFVP